MEKMIIKDSKFSKLFGSEFEFIDSGFQLGQFNMDMDMQRTEDVAAGKALPMFRVYGWNPWTLSLGANQKDADIDKDLCQAKGFDIVRRPTGGRAVLHADEITYSVVLPLPEGMTVHDVYRDVHIILQQSFKALGVELDFEKSQADFNNFYKESGMAVSCFASSARYEITSGGKKIVGSAQRLFGNVLLQHGSILLGDGHEQLSEIATVNSEDKRAVLKKYILSHSTTLGDIAGRKVNYEECASAIKNILV